MSKSPGYFAMPIAAGLLAAAAVPTVAFAATGTPASVVVFDQTIGGAKTVDVAYAYLPAKGYVTVFASDEAGNPVRKAIGSAEATAGDHRNLKVTLTEQPKQGQRLWVSLYRDADGKQGFDPAGDAAVWDGKLPSENAFIAR
jgi:hypothetical protein